MSQIENLIQVPKEFENLKQIIFRDLKKSNDSLKVFPKDFNFSLKENDESILLVIRTPLKKYIPKMIMGVLLSIFFPIIIYWPISRVEGSGTFLIGMIITSVMLLSTFLLYSFLKWYYNLGIITDKRIIDLDFHSVISHSMTEIKLEKIVDVTHKQAGISNNISDVGDLYIKTGGGNPTITFKKISKPRTVQDIINKLLEEKKKGDFYAYRK